MSFQKIVSKIAELAAKADTAGNYAVSVELDDLLMRSSELLSAPLPVDVQAHEAVTSVVSTASGDVSVSSHQEAVAACRDGLATHSDFVSAAAQKAYVRKDVQMMAALKAKDSFAAAVSYLISK